jgi:hypothetical protein
MTRERKWATIWGLAAAAALAALLLLGSGALATFDPALVCYTFAVLFAAFGVTYRFVMWVQRPPTAMYWKRGLQLCLRPTDVLRNLGVVLHRLTSDFVFNRFIFRRGRARGLAHWLIMWGCLIALAVTVPLVFGWVEFRTEPDNLGMYRVWVFGLPQAAFPIESLTGFVVFHVLVWPSLLIVAGVFLAIRRRLRDEGAAALQRFAEDFLPLVLLFAVSATGLMLTASYTWMKGYAYEFLAILHAVSVIFTLLWLPFGKLFHVFQRPAHLAVAVYKDAGRRGEQADCRRCGQPFASVMHVKDLITVEEQVGYRYEMKRAPAKHYQWVCPPCRRVLFGLAQAQLWTASPLHFSPGGAADNSQACERLDSGVGAAAPPGLDRGTKAFAPGAHAPGYYPPPLRG